MLTCTSNSTSNSTTNTETVAVDHELEGKDLLLKFYESCTKFITDVDDNDAALMERDKFEEGPELASAYKAVATKLAPIGWTGPWNMTKSNNKFYNSSIIISLSTNKYFINTSRGVFVVDVVDS